MKTFDNFYYEMVSLPNLYKAFEKAKKGKRRKKEVISFEEDLHNNLLNLHISLIDEDYLPSEYKVFYINEVKKRKILAPAFVDQIVHHAIFSFLESIYDNSFIYDSYACRKNKGTHKAFNRLKKMVWKHKRENYFLKCDISKYFYSIDQYKLKKILSKKIRDERVLNLLGKIIDSHKEERISCHIDNNDYSEQRKGIPIGNLISQLFSNIYLNELDSFVKHKLKVKNYVRYVDDFVIIDEDLNLLRNYSKCLKKFLREELFLELKDEKIQLNKISFGVDFVGFVAFKHYVRVRSKGYRRFVCKFKEKISLFYFGEIGFKEVRNSFFSYSSHLRYSNSKRLLGRLNEIYSVQIKRAVRRGGNWNTGADAGPFAVYLLHAPTITHTIIGFRCCSVPRENTLTSRSFCFSWAHKFAPSEMKTGAGIFGLRDSCNEDFLKVEVKNG